MNKLILAATAAVALMASAVASDSGPVRGQVVPGGCAGCEKAAVAKAGGCSCGGVDRGVGLNPLFARLMFWKKDTACGTCGGVLGGRLGNCAGTPTGGFNPYPNGVPGTLVFPQHPYVRSPRDWFEK